MGTWGVKPFENDAAFDWIVQLGDSADADVPKNVLLLLIAQQGIDGEIGSIGLAAAEAIAAAKGHPAEFLPNEVLDWIEKTHPRIDTGIVDLSLQAIDVIEGPRSALRDLWEETDASAWLAANQELRVRLRMPMRPSPASVRSKSATLRVKAGFVVELRTSRGLLTYLQFSGKSEIADLIRVLPGIFTTTFSDDELSSLVVGDTAFISQGWFKSILELESVRPRGIYPLPKSCAGPQPLKLLVPASDKNPRGWRVRYMDGVSLTAEEFAILHPDIDQTMLTHWSIPAPELLCRQVECEWRPWMHDQGWMYPEKGVGPVHASERRPSPYPASAKAGKFLIEAPAKSK